MQKRTSDQILMTKRTLILKFNFTHRESWNGYTKPTWNIITESNQDMSRIPYHDILEKEIETQNEHSSYTKAIKIWKMTVYNILKWNKI